MSLQWSGDFTPSYSNLVTLQLTFYSNLLILVTLHLTYFIVQCILLMTLQWCTREFMLISLWSSGGFTVMFWRLWSFLWWPYSIWCSGDFTMMVKQHYSFTFWWLYRLTVMFWRWWLYNYLLVILQWCSGDFRVILLWSYCDLLVNWQIMLLVTLQWSYSNITIYIWQ